MFVSLKREVLQYRRKGRIVPLFRAGVALRNVLDVCVDAQTGMDPGTARTRPIGDVRALLQERFNAYSEQAIGCWLGTAPVMMKACLMSCVSTASGRLSRQRTRSRMAVPVKALDFRMRAQDDRGVLLDAANEVARHRVCQPAARTSMCTRLTLWARNTAA